LDNTPQHVFISNKSDISNWLTYNATAHNEIQVPSAWADDSITVTLNLGTFSADATVYAYVVDSTGAISSAREITLGAADETAPTLSNLTPSGNVTYGTTKQLSVQTSESATCRYHASSVTWAEMSAMSSTGGTTHTQTVNVSVGANSFKVVCQDASANESTAGTWSFTVAAAATSSSISVGAGSQTISIGAGSQTIIMQ
jgi:AICAR transformylase/IMP cyclohydrolase PurH